MGYVTAMTHFSLSSLVRTCYSKADTFSHFLTTLACDVQRGPHRVLHRGSKNASILLFLGLRYCTLQEHDILRPITSLYVSNTSRDE